MSITTDKKDSPSEPQSKRLKTQVSKEEEMVPDPKAVHIARIKEIEEYLRVLSVDHQENEKSLQIIKDEIKSLLFLEELSNATYKLLNDKRQMLCRELAEERHAIEELEAEELSSK